MNRKVSPITEDTTESLIAELKLLDKNKKTERYREIFEELKKRNSSDSNFHLPERLSKHNRQTVLPLASTFLLSIIIYSLVAWMLYKGETISRHDGFNRIDDPFYFWLVVVSMLLLTTVNLIRHIVLRFTRKQCNTRI